jgi:crossover junction endodeoxyribonuclease RusA
MNKLTIELPYPDRRLSPNAHCHWRIKDAVGKVAKYEARSCCSDQLQFAELPLGNKPLRMTLTFYPPNRRKRDRDNAIASMKYYIDGVFQFLCIDDSVVEEIVTGRWGDVVKNGKVVMELEEI